MPPGNPRESISASAAAISSRGKSTSITSRLCVASDSVRLMRGWGRCPAIVPRLWPFSSKCARYSTASHSSQTRSSASRFVGVLKARVQRTVASGAFAGSCGSSSHVQGARRRISGAWSWEPAGSPGLRNNDQDGIFPDGHSVSPEVTRLQTVPRGRLTARLFGQEILHYGHLPHLLAAGFVDADGDFDASEGPGYGGLLWRSLGSSTTPLPSSSMPLVPRSTFVSPSSSMPLFS